MKIQYGKHEDYGYFLVVRDNHSLVLAISEGFCTKCKNSKDYYSKQELGDLYEKYNVPSSFMMMFWMDTTSMQYSNELENYQSDHDYNILCDYGIN